MESAWLTYCGGYSNPAYIVNRAGRVAWIGDPQDIEEPLKLILADKWDLAAKAAQYKEAVAEQKSAFAEDEAAYRANEAIDESLSRALEEKRDDDALKLVEGVEDKENLGSRVFPTVFRADTRALHLAILSITGKQPGKAVELGKKLMAGDTNLLPSEPPFDLVISAIVTPQEILDYEPGGMYRSFITYPRDEKGIPPEIHFSPALHLDPALAKVAAKAADGVDYSMYAGGFSTRIEYANRRILLARIYQAAGEKDKAIGELKKATAALQVIVHDSNEAIAKAHALEKDLGALRDAENRAGK